MYRVRDQEKNRYLVHDVYHTILTEGAHAQIIPTLTVEVGASGSNRGDRSRALAELK